MGRARSPLRKGLAIAEALAARDPANTEWQRDLSVADRWYVLLNGLNRFRQVINLLFTGELGGVFMAKEAKGRRSWRIRSGTVSAAWKERLIQIKRKTAPQSALP
jgi:hypothetical protein